MLRTKQVYVVVVTGLMIALAAASCSRTAVVPIVPIVDVEELQSGAFQHADKLLIRMSQSEWDEANVEIVEGVVPATAGASLLIFEIPTLPDGEFVRFFKPNCPPCYDVTFTYYGWQCLPTSACIGEGDLPPCAEIRFFKDRLVCFGSCPNGGTCEYRAIQLPAAFASFAMQVHATELTAILIEMKDSRFKRNELFARTRVIGYYCGCG